MKNPSDELQLLSKRSSATLSNLNALPEGIKITPSRHKENVMNLKAIALTATLAISSLAVAANSDFLLTVTPNLTAQ